MPDVLVGTSGFSYDHWADGVFYPPRLARSKWLPYFAERFPTVELNVTHYRLPKREVFDAWDRETPGGFRFALKGSRLITHYHRLHDVDEAVAAFFEHAAPLGGKLLCVLWQLPANAHADPGRLDAFCDLLGRTAPRMRHAFEFRDRSWFQEGIYRVLERHGCALCVAHSPTWPREEVVTAPFVYVRMHGSERAYDSEYAEDELRVWAAKVAAWRDGGRDVYVYFNNDPHGYAVRNAARLMELTGTATGVTAAAR